MSNNYPLCELIVWFVILIGTAIAGATFGSLDGGVVIAAVTAVRIRYAFLIFLAYDYITL